MGEIFKSLIKSGLFTILTHCDIMGNYHFNNLLLKFTNFQHKFLLLGITNLNFTVSVF